MNLRYIEEEKRPFDLMIYAVRRRLPGNNFDNEQIRVQLQLLDANFDVVTVYGAIYLSRMRVLYNLTVIPVVWGSYYRNVICIARSVGVVGNWVVCYLKGCNMSRLCLDEYFSLFCIWHYCNFHSKS